MFRLASFRVATVAAFAVAATGCKSHPSFKITCDVLDGGVLTDLGAPCYAAPTAVPARTACSTDITRNCDPSGGAAIAPNLSCVSVSPGDMALTAPIGFVFLTGYVHAWANGIDTNNLSISIFDANQLTTGQDPATLATISLATSGFTPANIQPDRRSGCDADLRFGCNVQSAGDCGGSCGDGLEGRRDTGQFCSSDGHCRKRLRWELPYLTQNAVPTGRPLVFRVSGPNNRSSNTYVTTLEWRITLPGNPRTCRPSPDPNAPAGDSDPNDTECLGTETQTVTTVSPTADGGTMTTITHPVVTAYRHNVNVVSIDDWNRVAVATGETGGVRHGQSLIIGEAHDCDGVRLDNVQVSVTPMPSRMAYFKGSDAVQTPDLTRGLAGTTPLGSFVAVDVGPGQTTVESAGGATEPGGALTLAPFGRFDFTTYADTVTLVNLNK